MKRARYSMPNNIGVCNIDYYDEIVVGLQLSSKCDSESSCENTPFSDAIFKQVMEYLERERKEFDLVVDVSSQTPFQQKVLRELQSIPYGEVRSYKQIAEAIGNPKAARAVGGACNRNPIHLIIPCHRVVGEKGALTGFAAGLELKKYLLDLEDNNS